MLNIVQIMGSKYTLFKFQIFENNQLQSEVLDLFVFGVQHSLWYKLAGSVRLMLKGFLNVYI